MKRITSGIMLTLLLTTVLTFVEIHTVKAIGTIYIKADGSVDPPTAPIERSEDVYAFIDDIFNMSIVVQRDNTILDGNGHLLQTTQTLDRGIDLFWRNNITITRIVISGFGGGIWLDSSCYNKIVNNTVIGKGNSGITENIGIMLYQSDYNNLTSNMVMNTDCGIDLRLSSNNILNGNKVHDSFQGISLYRGRHNTLRSNVMSSNRYNFYVGIFELSSYINDVDTSNVVDGKPIYYWINHFGETVPLDAGCLVIVNSSNIVARNLTLKKNMCGVNFAYTIHSLIENVVTTECGTGINLDHSDFNVITRNEVSISLGAGVGLMLSNNNTISYNTVMNTTGCGIWLEDTYMNKVIGNNVAYSHGGAGPQEFNGAGILVDDSSSCRITGNNVTNNMYGIVVGAFASRSNLIIGNDIRMNYVGLILFEGKNNIVYHNDFVENEMQPIRTYQGTANTLDNGYPSGGNYWSDYGFVDLYGGPLQNVFGSDGIGDVQYVVDANNVDRYPLINPRGGTYAGDVNCDVNGDGKVDMRDIAIVGIAFGSYPGHPRWNANADINSDAKIDMKDVGTVAKQFGKTV